ncbi:hypothetical protein [Novosphingobium sp.]|uniref:hypothetical protein n=1 Tax=Novosphingobium sp. TaxID=1874826 RepID=UPI0025D5B734|nr:hypothetical protein [Novosphingobium sp.]MCC6927064.1 hypothetical protein [Novosphingobium sp.]
MANLTSIGLFHTAISLIALTVGFISLARNAEIRTEEAPGRVYLVSTVLTALSALLIHERTAFGPGHILAVLALGAIGLGLIAGRNATPGSWRHLLKALALSFTMLCHLIPGVSETLTRLPPGDPVAASFDSPLLAPIFLGLVVSYAVFALYQIVRLRRTRA